MLPGEAVSPYLFELKRLLDQAITGLANDARDRLLIHQFLVGLPESVSRQLWAIGDTGNLDRLAERAKIMITAMEQIKKECLPCFPVEGADCGVNRASCCSYNAEEGSSSTSLFYLPAGGSSSA